MPHPAPEPVVALTRRQVIDIVRRGIRSISLTAIGLPEHDIDVAAEGIANSLTFAAPAREDAWELEKLMAFAGGLIDAALRGDDEAEDSCSDDFLEYGPRGGNMKATPFGKACLAAFARREQAKAEKENGYDPH